MIDSGYLQTNVDSARIVALLRHDRKTMRRASVKLASGVGEITYGVDGMMDVTISLTSNTLELLRQICLRALVCNDVTTDLIIGLHSIKFLNILRILKAHLDTMTWCKICATKETARGTAARDT